MKILITGAGGHLGLVLARRLSVGHTVVAADSRALDVCDPAAIDEAVEVFAPDAILNCAAYTDVDGAEEEPVRALEVNAFAVRSLAAAACRVGAVLVHYSTDFVFDGRARRPYVETDPPNPRSTYACSKLIGEWFAQEVPRHYVLRVESLFGERSSSGRRTTIDRIVDRVLAGEEVRVFTDRVTTPSYTPDVSDATEALLERRAAPGIYHCVNSGACSFGDLATEVARCVGGEPRLVSMTMKDARLRAERPAYCALANERLAALGVAMPPWQDALARYLRDRRATP